MKNRIKLSKNFYLDEFECHCGIEHDFIVDVDFLFKLQNARDESNVKWIINRGYSCPEHNTKVGGASRSQHLQQVLKAVDVKCLSNTHRALMVKSALNVGMTYIKVYPTHIHMDMRDSPTQKLEVA